MALYAEIVEIVAPTGAVPGTRVDIQVKIKNRYASTIGIKVGGALEYGVTPWPGIAFPSNWADVAGGQTHSFDGHFTMPDREVKIHADSYYYSGGTWYLDDEKTEDVRVIELGPAFSEFRITDYLTV